MSKNDSLITKREYISSMMLQALITNNRTLYEAETMSEDNGVDPADTLIPLAIRYADYLIAKLNPKPIVAPESDKVVRIKKK